MSGVKNEALKGGRNQARIANQQAGSKVKVQNFAQGGGIAMMRPTMMRGSGAATKGKKFEGVK